MKSIVFFTSILRIVLITLIISFAVYANAQNVAINTSGSSADASAMLDVSSSSKGFLPPRMTTVQRTGIPSPAHGLMVYDTDTKTYWFFSTTWKEITNGGGGGGGFALPYSGVADNIAPAFSVTNTNIGFGSSAVYGRGGSTGSGITPLGNSGVWGDNTTGIGVAGTSKSIGVFGGSGVNDPSGIGVLGISSGTSANNGAVTAINQSTGNALFAESIGGGTAIYGKTAKSNGAAIYGINNAVQGHGIRGAAAGNDGAAIYGDAGVSNSNSYAGFFRNWNAANSKNVVQIDNLGTGNFLSLTDGLGDTKTTIAKSGNINTDGNIYTQGDLYVNGLKGIVRNTYSNQMRMEVMQLTVPGGFHFVISGEFISTQTVSFNFNTPFASAPAVYRANLVTPSYNVVELLDYRIFDVTTTGFKIEIFPSSSLDFTSSNATFKFVAIGND